jgi:signal transduction histidine kinase
MARQPEEVRQPMPATSGAADRGKALRGSYSYWKPDLIWHIDDEGLCFDVAPRNGAPSALLEQNSVASNVHDLLPSDAGRILMRLVRKAIAASAAQICELNLQVNGRNALFQVQVVPYTDHGALTVIHDISERRRTEKELRRSQRQLRELTDHLQSAREEERTRIARDIHDQMGQSLTALKIDLACLRAHLNGDSRRVEEDLAGMTTSVEAIIRSVQDIAAQLRPRILDDFGLSAAVEWQVKKFSERTGVRCTCTVPAEELQVENQAATALFRILQEALTNVARHAHASNVSVRLEEQKDWTSLEILDDGRGVQEPDTCHPFALGVIGMQERARSLDGNASVTSRLTGGTRVWVRVPAQSLKKCSGAERRRRMDRRGRPRNTRP